MQRYTLGYVDRSSSSRSGLWAAASSAPPTCPWTAACSAPSYAFRGTFAQRCVRDSVNLSASRHGYGPGSASGVAPRTL
eukprot:4635914-Alexandrium_andersonii.AAC.1